MDLVFYGKKLFHIFIAFLSDLLKLRSIKSVLLIFKYKISRKVRILEHLLLAKQKIAILFN